MNSTDTHIAAPDPLWFKDAIIYQLHLKSFFDANNDGVGDFEGLLQKLDYVAELGVTAVWLLPFYPSPRRDDGYDIADYTGVHEDYGTIDDVRRFVKAAHERGLKVITELVINHTSDQHPWFQAARLAPPGSPEREMYVWSDTDQKYADTRIIFLDTEKSNWTWDPVAGAYFWHRFYSHQPDLNFDNPAVLEEVLTVMRFWLDIGIDGLRLDAVPYLVEREGTNNENLPETHAILKRIRAEIDAYAPGCMLLSEANQWPEDAQQYFGEGDECHMSFHFPLMPRMYMAIAREDRFPITDIMRQTPEIPASCQWAVFLRNHDELTLEMVTDSERDYLWDTYAADHRARLNLGIRRRLAPLLQRDRRRIELMNGMLLSMPGTPVIYYGDEIGMGDNIHLGDRDGVRTPMQWSIDRNGGFSRADPASLVSPPIMDPLYGFQAVNVEAQDADPHSLLNWMRRMLAVRKEFLSFGRGTQRFLTASNRKILAFVRELPADGDRGGETVLCVFNLSRASQAVELDLSEFAGRVPVGMIGGSVFPPIGALNYLITLPPYAFFWFWLSQASELPSWHAPVSEPLPDFATLVVRHDIEEALSTGGRAVLEREALPAYLPKRRWFAAKGRELGAITIAYAVRLPCSQEQVLLTELDVQIDDGHDRYVLPLGIAWEDEMSGSLASQLALARLRRGRRVGYLTDAFAIDPFARGMLACMADATEIAFPEGRIVFRPTSLMQQLDIPDDVSIRRLSAEQTNSSLVMGPVVIKLVRRTLAGIHPEAEMTRYLGEHGFANTASLYGEMLRIDHDGTPHTLGLIQGFVLNQGDGWGWTLDYLALTVEELAVAGGEPPAGVPFADYKVFAAAMGRRLAELHALLAEAQGDPAFEAEEASETIREAWAEGAIAQIDMALDLLRAETHFADAHTADAVAVLLRHQPAIRDAARKLAQASGRALQTRVHGDFHLGQVLVSQGDAYIIDFEGEPARTMEQRRAKSSPMRDVAGLLRSFDYATATAREGRGAASPQTTERRLALLEQFRVEAAETFLEAYREIAANAPRQWVSDSNQAALLDLFLLEKAAYEIRYEATNRPGWLAIPLEGLLAIAQRLVPGMEIRPGPSS
jgi:maltose alpha-D-glucosyltransferase/alpha-amylase